MADDVRERLARLIDPMPFERRFNIFLRDRDAALAAADRILAAGWTPPDTAAADTRKAAWDRAIEITADLRNTQHVATLSWWACNELLGRFHTERAPIVPAIIPQGQDDGCRMHD
jgi:hypothetical protein